MTVAQPAHASGKLVALCGGIGGAKLVLGLSRLVPPERLSVIVNIGDDFRHFGLHVCPDLDTVTYTLAGRANPETGWGRANESWRFMEAVAELGGETWFSLGDTDLATNAVRTERLLRGERLTDVTRDMVQALGVATPILPASDDRLATIVETDEGELAFQRYFVGEQCQPRIRELRYEGAGQARPTPEVMAALADPELLGLVICPSNPYLSVDPMLSLAGFREALRGMSAPIVAVSPIVGGKAIKGPLAKMMKELGKTPDPKAIAAHYEDFLDVFIIDEADADVADQIEGPSVHVAQTVMNSLDDRISLAHVVLDAAASCRKRVRA